MEGQIKTFLWLAETLKQKTLPIFFVVVGVNCTSDQTLQYFDANSSAIWRKLGHISTWPGCIKTVLETPKFGRLLFRTTSVSVPNFIIVLQTTEKKKKKKTNERPQPIYFLYFLYRWQFWFWMSDVKPVSWSKPRLKQPMMNGQIEQGTTKDKSTPKTSTQKPPTKSHFIYFFK